MRMTGYGMEYANRVGDYFVRINVSVPTDLKEEDINAIREISNTYS
jgi:DnaJ-class molecular chaperone